MVTVPDHDSLIQHIKGHVHEAVRKKGWPFLRENCSRYDLSPTILRKIYFWDSKDDTSFNFMKLLQAYDFAYDVIEGRVA